uniref:Uncharacterized protein n=1 Tax=Kalanchoe fedtschenkoi TaxID=63787 RepID=A0A7N0VEZ6_KALFE
MSMRPAKPVLFRCRPQTAPESAQTTPTQLERFPVHGRLRVLFQLLSAATLDSEVLNSSSTSASSAAAGEAKCTRQSARMTKIRGMIGAKEEGLDR